MECKKIKVHRKTVDVRTKEGRVEEGEQGKKNIKEGHEQSTMAE